jgi:putative transposase
MSKANKSSIKDKAQSSIFDFADDILSEEEKKLIEQESQIPIQIHISHENHIQDSEKFKDDDSSNLRSEQIIISKDNYPSIRTSDSKHQFYQSIDVFSECCHHSKNLFNQCLYQIRQAYFNKIDLNLSIHQIYLINALNKTNTEKEIQLRIGIRNQFNKYKNSKFEDLKNKNYKNQIYKLLDKYFKSTKDDNYIWSPQASQQIIDKCVESWLDNDLGRRDYDQHPDHRVDYTGRPGLPNYRKSSEFISIFTNQQCHLENKEIVENTNDLTIKWLKKHILTFPDHLNIKPIITRLNSQIDLREVRIIPLIKTGFYKIEIVYQKVINRLKIKSLNLDENRIIGIDTGQENVLTIANNIGISPIIIKGGIILAINQWFDKISSKLYEIYYRQQGHKGKESKGIPIVMGSKMAKLSFDRMNAVLDILHKISRFVVEYCIRNKIGTIVLGRNPGWKQFINLRKKTNQKFTKIPHYLLFRLMKYKAEEVGIKVIDIEESHTSKCSFPDEEEICHHDKYLGKRTRRGLFRSLKGIIINADVNAAYNIIRKVFPEAFKSLGIEGVVLHPERLSIKDLLSRPNS